MRRNKHGFVEVLAGMVMLAAYGIALVVAGLGYIAVKAAGSDASSAPPAKQEEQQKSYYDKDRDPDKYRPSYQRDKCAATGIGC